jgi:hypothetical protein
VAYKEEDAVFHFRDVVDVLDLSACPVASCRPLSHDTVYHVL